MRILRSPVLLSLALAVTISGCSKQPPEEPTASAAPTASAVSEPNLARSAPDAGKVEQVSVKASGRGSTVAAAVDQALKLAIQQVNGKTIDMSSLQFQAGMAVAFGEERVDIGSSGFAEFIATQSRGAITGFQLVSQRDLENGDTEVSIEAKVAKFARPDSAGMLRVAVMPLRTGSEAFVIDTTSVAADAVVQAIRGSITNALVQSKRVTVLDREYSQEVQSELDLLEGGRMSTDDFARLGEQLMADYVVVGQIDRFGYERHERHMRTSDRTVVSHSGGASISFRVINATTGQIELSDTVSVELPATAPTTLGTSINASKVSAELADSLAADTADAVIMRLFPLTLVAVDGNDVVLSQGGRTVSVGDVYEVVLRGKEITDPQTGRVIGRVEKPCCSIEVTRVGADLSYATVLQTDIDLASAFAPGALEVSGPGKRRPAPAVASGTVGAGAPQPVAASAGPSVVVAPAVASPADHVAGKPAAQEDPNW